jgi:hypothetical protein
VSNVTNDDDDDGHPAWSPDGTRMLFTSDRDGDDEIFSMNAGGGNLLQLTMNTADDCCAEWQPNNTGDASCFGVVNAIDAALVLQFVAQLLSPVPCSIQADANESGGIDAIDALLILQYVADLIADLPP